MIFKLIRYFGQPVFAACDSRCDKAWGINTRPKRDLSEDPDDYEFLADDELGLAPVDPGTYEGSHAKPVHPDERLNKWCVRECERCKLNDATEWRLGSLELPDFSRPMRNIQGTAAGLDGGGTG